MALIKLEDFNPNYREELFDGDDIKGLDVYAGRTEEKIGSIDTALVDEMGYLRYLVIDTGFWIFGKKILLPVGRCHIDEKAKRIYAIGLLNKKQAEDLPEYKDSMTVDYDYEEHVRRAYRMPAVEASTPLETSALLNEESPLETSQQSARAASKASPSSHTSDNRSTYNYQQEPYLYDMNEQNHKTLKLYEERLVASKTRRKAGEVAIGKHVESKTVQASVPIETERVVIERMAPDAIGSRTTPSTADFQNREVARIETYEETPDIHKEAFVREEVKVTKEVEREVVNAEETLRQEKLDVQSEGRPVVEKHPDNF
jgi:uncharacterized protein (TIGR02271 family)